MYDKSINVKKLQNRIKSNGVKEVEIESELLEECSLEEIKRGFMKQGTCYTCLLCGEHFEQGEIYTFSERLCEGSKAITMHIEEEHQSMQHFLLQVDASSMGISDLQLQLLNFFASGLTDKAIAEELGVSGSTVRNHRYKLRERERQNKLFLALMESMEESSTKGKGKGESSLVSEKERKRILERYMTEAGQLKCYPDFEKNRRIVLEAIIEQFSVGEPYQEEEVREILSGIYPDEQFLKNELMAYGYLDRTYKGAIYWVKNHEKVG